MSSAGGAPPPPPPPFKFPGMVVHQPRPPPSVVSEPPSMASIQKAGMPAALAGAMMKDKKPFTYTPGGLDLSEIKSPSMQRRLQRNASLEGVKPSPLAQQTTSPAQSSSPLPPQGMIQVLPMPGVGMAPVVKPQSKEPKKSTRTVCGPAPLPPPFACGAGSNAKLAETEKMNTNNTLNSHVNNTDNQNNVPPSPKVSVQIPTNNVDCNGSSERKISDDTSYAANIPLPPPIPSHNVKKVVPKPDKTNLNDFVDLTELESTINSLTNHLNSCEDIKPQIDMDLPTDEKPKNENITDCLSEFTDCSSPFYPDEQNSVQNLSEQSQDIASSSDVDYNTFDEQPKMNKPNNSRWNPDRKVDTASGNTIPLQTNGQSLSGGNGLSNQNHVPQNNSVTNPVPKTFPTTPELVKNSPLSPYDDGLGANKYSNGPAIDYTENENSNINSSNAQNEQFVRQSSLPTTSITKIIPRNIDNGVGSIKLNGNYEQHIVSQEKPSLEMDKPLPWMVGIKKEPSPGPDFGPRANKPQQRLQRQMSLPQNDESKYQSAPWRHPHYKSSDSSNRNRSISPQSIHFTSNQQPIIPTPADEGFRTMGNQSLYATLPSNHRNKAQNTYFQNSIMQQNNPVQTQHKERIIPIMLEPTPPTTPQGNFGAFNLNSSNNDIAIDQNNSHYSHPYPGTNQYSNTPNNFSQFNPTSPPYSINATEALHQIQHNLNKLNNGLQTEESVNGQNVSNGYQGANGHQGIQVVMTNDSPAIQSKSFNIIQKAYDPSSSNDSNPEEPRKYTGSNIPSLSFKVLQAMTDSQANDDWNPESSPEAMRSDGLAYPSKIHNNGNRFVSPESKHFSPDPYSSVSPFSSSNSFESVPPVVQCYKGVRPTPNDQTVPPQSRITNAPQNTRSINSPLNSIKLHSNFPQMNITNNRPSSAMSQSSIGSDTVPSTTYGFNSSESPSRLLSIIQQESEKVKNIIPKDVSYSGDNRLSTSSNILPNGFSNNQYENIAQNSFNSPNNVLVNAMKRNLTINDRNPYSPTPSGSSSTDQDEFHEEGIIRTAAAKQSVLKELTSHFDPKTALKKPSAAPGRVFKHLQEQYDSPLDQEICYQRPNNYEEKYVPQLKPYDGLRIPGNTFRMLQENIETHPSALQARK